MKFLLLLLMFSCSPAGDPAIRVKRVRVEQSYPSPYGLNNDNRSTLTLSEVQVFEASKTMWGSTVNVAQGKSATQSSTYQVTSSTFGPPSFAVDGNTDTFNHVDFTTGQVGTGEIYQWLSVVPAGPSLTLISPRLIGLVGGRLGTNL